MGIPGPRRGCMQTPTASWPCNAQERARVMPHPQHSMPHHLRNRHTTGIPATVEEGSAASSASPQETAKAVARSAPFHMGQSFRGFPAASWFIEPVKIMMPSINPQIPAPSSRIPLMPQVNGSSTRPTPPRTAWMMPMLLYPK